jgi:putative restriction endonuclease
VVADAYQWRCAITGSKIRPALQAAHILPVKPTHGGEHRLDNGLLNPDFLQWHLDTVFKAA